MAIMGTTLSTRWCCGLPRDEAQCQGRVPGRDAGPSRRSQVPRCTRGAERRPRRPCRGGDQQPCHARQGQLPLIVCVSKEGGFG